VVLKHYFRPGREDFRQVLLKAMPKMLADVGQKSTAEKKREILEQTSRQTWERDRRRLLELLSGL